jgi:murein DD-endopeptidase MepM/ murein hydrolase activator NlpD
LFAAQSRSELCYTTGIHTGRPVILSFCHMALMRMEEEFSRYLFCFIKSKFKTFSYTLSHSLFIGLFLYCAVYTKTEASFLSSILGDQVFAQTNQVTPAISSTNNSQTMALLTSNVSSASIVQEKSSKTDKISDSQIKDSVNVNIVSDSAILPATGPLGVSDGIDVVDPSSDQTSIYVIRKGDTLSAIADMFGVSVNTILLANDMKKGDKLVEGDVLFILPISGIEHTIAKGQTLKSIAKLYKVDINDIAFYNNIDLDEKLAVGDTLVIPGGDMIDEGGDKPASNLGSSTTRDQNYYITHPLQTLLGYFINPVPTGHKTQGLHGPGNRGIDIGAPTGTPIYASAIGKVLIVKTGCKVGQTRCGGGYGNMTIVQHPNGTKTLYGHMSKVATKIGNQVAQGEIIGYVGNTGHSTGPHIHFEVFNAKNPGVDWSWAN